jgi:hypothetical protein
VRLFMSADFHDGVTDSFHLINTVRVSTGLLTENVRKVVSAGADDSVLEALYEMPVGASGQNLRAFAAQTSQDHEVSIATLWLFTVVGRYEVWADSLPIASGGRGCQFPSQGHATASLGVGYAEAFAGLASFPMLQDAYGASAATDARHLGGRVDDALMIYRLYKECRNSLAHAGGRASELVERWGVEVSTRAQDLHVDGSGMHLPLPLFKQGDTVKLTFAHLRCLVSVLLRIVFTVDSTLLMSYEGHREFVKRWQAAYGDRPVNVARRKLRGINWIRAQLQPIGVPVPDNPIDVLPYLAANALVRELL